MLLVVDCGNTNIVFAVFDGDTIRAQWRAATKSERTADELGVWLTQLMARDGIATSAVNAAIIASVVPGRNHDLTRLCEDVLKCAPRFVGESGLNLGVAVKVERPNEVGADRLVNALAARRAYNGPMIVVDFGTATTFDVVDGSGAYCGGCIAPGVNLSMEALHNSTALLPRRPVRNPGTAPVVGGTTAAQMNSGVFWGYVGLIEGLVTRIKAERAEPMKVIATGGLASLFADATKVIDAIDADLTLRGLKAVHDLNR